MFEALDAELVSAYSHTRSVHTLAQYRCVLRLFGEHLAEGNPSGHVPDGTLDSLTARDVESFLGTVQDRASSATCRSYFLVLRAVFNFAVRRGLLAANPTAAVQPPRAERRVRAVLTPDEVSALVTGRPTRSKFLDARDTAIVSLLAGSGLRRSEVCRLLVSDLSLDEGIVTCRGTKTGQDRVVPFDDRTRVAMRRWLRERARRVPTGTPPERGAVPDGTPLFTSRATGLALTPSAVTQMVRGRADAVGLDYERAVHSLRHYAAHTWLSAGISDLNVQTLGGWSSPAMLSVYGAGGKTVRAIDAYRKLPS